MGGLTLALAAAKAGMPVRVYDASDTPDSDWPLELTANGTRVLQALGLRPGLEAISLAPAFSLLRDAGSGFLLSQRPLGAFSDARYGAPCLVTTEQNLKKLLAASCEVHGVVRASEAVLEIEPETGTVTTDSSGPE